MATLRNDSLPFVLPNASSSASETTRNGLTIILLSFALLIIAVNALVFVCFLMNRNDFKNFVTVQILGFSITDMLVGLAAIPVILTFQLTTAFPYYETCAAVMYVYCFAQVASLFHAFGICIHRLVIIKRCVVKRDAQPKRMYKIILLQILLVWVVSALVVSVPFLLYGKSGDMANECSLNALFGEKYVIAIAFVNTILLTLQASVNIIYIYMFRFLFNTWQRINTTQRLRSSSATHYGTGRRDGYAESRIDKTTPIEEKDNTTRLTENRTAGSSDCSVRKPRLSITVPIMISDSDKIFHRTNIETKDEVLQFQKQDCKGTINKTYGDAAKDTNCKKKLKPFIFQMNTETSTSKALGIAHRIYCKQHKNFLPDQCPDVPVRSNNITIPGSQITVDKYQTVGNSGFKGQRDVLITIGMILLVLNICMTPLNALVIIEIINKTLLTRNVKFILMGMALVNSALDPFIYALRIKPFRQTLRNTFSCCHSPR